MKTHSLLLSLGAATLLSFSTFASEFIEGKDYFKMDFPIHTNTKNEVKEFFLYQCPHCFNFEEDLNEWKTSNKEVDFSKTPAMVNEKWSESALWFLIIKTRKESDFDTLNASLFKKIHSTKKPFDFNRDDFLDWAVINNLDIESVKKDLESYFFHIVLNDLYKVSDSYSENNINFVPSLVVNGSYWTSPSLKNVNSHKKALEIVDFLLSID